MLTIPQQHPFAVADSVERAGITRNAERTSQIRAEEDPALFLPSQPAGTLVLCRLWVQQAGAVRGWQEQLSEHTVFAPQVQRPFPATLPARA